MKKRILFLLLLAVPAWGQYPGAGIPTVTPDKELKVIFKDVTDHHLLAEVRQTFAESAVVKPFVMTRAQRGFIEFNGKYAGDRRELLQILHSSVGGKLHIRAKSKEADGLEIMITGLSRL